MASGAGNSPRERRRGLYRSFAQLRQAEPPDAYAIASTPCATATAIVAPHGGRIESGTSAVARAIAGEDLSLYLFEGRRRRGNWEHLHIDSERFDEPMCLKLVATAERVVTVHGARGIVPVVYVGGRDAALADRIADALNAAGFHASRTMRPALQGLHHDNICNRGTSGAGVQLEMSIGLRRLCRNTARLDAFAAAVRDALRR